jgi:hypothetical protein
MAIVTSRMRAISRIATVAVPILLMLAIGVPSSTASDSDDQSIYTRFEEVSSLRSQGHYDEAIGILKDIIREYSQSDQVLRRAYTDLVFTLLSKGDRTAARESAREAVLRFPDLEADPIYFPLSINDMYTGLRKELFGSLNVDTRPDSCRVFLDTEFVGFTPLELAYVRVGHYTLNLSRTGYHDESMSVRIDPGSPATIRSSLARQRDKAWWLWRAGPAAVLSGILLAIQLHEDEPTPEPSPLPEPPPPPGN